MCAGLGGVWGVPFFTLFRTFFCAFSSQRGFAKGTRAAKGTSTFCTAFLSSESSSLMMETSAPGDVAMIASPSASVDLRFLSFFSFFRSDTAETSAGASTSECLRFFSFLSFLSFFSTVSAFVGLSLAIVLV